MGGSPQHFACAEPGLGVFRIGVGRKAIKRHKRVSRPFPDLAPSEISLSACGIVPLCFSREPAMRPATIGLRIVPRDVCGARLRMYGVPASEGVDFKRQGINGV